MQYTKTWWDDGAFSLFFRILAILEQLVLCCWWLPTKCTPKDADSRTIQENDRSCVSHGRWKEWGNAKAKWILSEVRVISGLYNNLTFCCYFESNKMVQLSIMNAMFKVIVLISTAEHCQPKKLWKPRALYGWTILQESCVVW